MNRKLISQTIAITIFLCAITILGFGIYFMIIGSYDKGAIMLPISMIMIAYADIKATKLMEV